MTWLPLLTFFAHMIEECPRLPAWATRHFGATSNAWYVYSHIVLVALIGSICWWAGVSPAKAWGPLLLIANSWSLACNAGFHIVTTWLFREYSPGVVTGTLLSHSQIATAVAIGTVWQVGVVAGLWLRMDRDWSLRRSRR